MSRLKNINVINAIQIGGGFLLVQDPVDGKSILLN